MKERETFKYTSQFRDAAVLEDEWSQRGESVSAWLVLSQGQSVGRLGVHLLMTFEMQEVLQVQKKF